MTASHDTERLLDALSRPSAYPHEAEEVRSMQTHISAVFLAGPHAYKVKKPVTFDFLDFSTLERRRHFCHAEVRLNRRLAPSVYHGVVPIVAGVSGLRVLDCLLDDASDAVPVGPGQEVVEWAVRMTRLPQERTLKSLLRRGELDGGNGAALLRRLARLLADFHSRADRGEEIAAAAGFAAVTANANDNFDELEDAVGTTVSTAVLRRLRQDSGRTLSTLQRLMERRARQKVPCDTHGDLRLGHVYQLENGPGQGPFVIIDCVEFNDRFRYADPVSDIALLAMELEFEGRPDLSRVLVDHYLQAARDPEGAELLDYYVAYRDIVRGKVRTLAAKDPLIPGPERARAAGRATRHFLRALGRLAPPDERPVLVLVGGLPGVGKSVLARALARDGNFVWIDTDRVRKQLAGRSDGPSTPDGFEEGLYTPERTQRTYEECLRRARSLLFDGSRVVVEASFRTERSRAAFLGAAHALGVPALLLLCEADRDVLRRRLAARAAAGSVDDPSDADWAVYEEMERRWEELGPGTALMAHHIRGDRSPAEVGAEATRILRAGGFRA
jgi:uncharacterized protein